MVGAGPAGLAAALTAGQRSGARVLLIDERPAAGGALLTKRRDGLGQRPCRRAGRRCRTWSTCSAPPSPVTTTTTYLIAVERRTGQQEFRDHREMQCGNASGASGRSRVILATGAHERPIVFAGNDAPGVMLAESVRVYLQRYGVLAGEQVVLFTAHDDAYRVAGELMAAGASVVVVDPRIPEGQVARPRPGDATPEPCCIGSVVTGTQTGDRRRPDRRAWCAVRTGDIHVPSRPICWPSPVAGTRPCTCTRRPAASWCSTR